VPVVYLDKVFSVMERTPRHTYQILTKRANRLPEYFHNRTCPENVCLGVSVEDRQYGVPRIAELRKVRARIRFLSVEPLLEDIGEFDLTGIHWVIVGGESGPKSRPMKEKWVENVKRQADAAGAAFFFKQWGAWGADGVKRNKKANGRIFQGRTWDTYPENARAAL
ncbi:MAG: DUF5131 family protein, partial [Candidatus Hydrogenedentes bacterium]|nr:DUF5131 family protein [Candidatus Hydrogenedentota bacterium]